MAQNEEKKQSIKTDPEMIPIIEFTDRAIMTVFHMLEKVEGNMRRYMDDKRKTQIDLLDMKTTMSWIKIVLDGSNSRLVSAKEKITNVKAQQRKLTKMKHREK